MSDDRAIEVDHWPPMRLLAEAAMEGVPGSRRLAIKRMEEALASAGFQITDLTAEEADAVAFRLLEPVAEAEDDFARGYRKLRRLSGANGG